MTPKYFTWDEFDSPDMPGSGEKYMNREFVRRLDRAREQAGVPFVITSGFRTEKHNRSLPNASTKSSHMYGLAVDISAVDSFIRAEVLLALVREGFTRIGIAKTFIHVDMDDSKSSPRVWTY
jgi:uncharacterized protein YcbK (DUF882 family)